MPTMNMLTPTPTTVHLKDYTPPPFLISTVELDVDIQDGHAIVRSTLAVARNPRSPQRGGPLVLDGDELELEFLAIDGKALAPAAYSVDSEHLTIAGVPDRFTLNIACRIEPRKNTRLMGLYASKDGYFTQCEAEGFRRITYFLDRPDVMARYTVTIHADREAYPMLLSNGNLVASGEDSAQDGKARHWARWEDPFPKPSYLFAMVAARLDKLEESFVTRSGRKVCLQIYVEPGKLDQSAFAMEALKKSMRWDEEVFGLELDLDQYMIVAVGDFNMGAMENKGLNIFNTKYVLARPDTATDSDFMFIDRVVAHEYFHNWTGNRVTCRDWFQLSLKEGLTVFRDQEFGADTYSRPVQRIQEVRALRAAQFPEDAGPMAHPIRPQSYMEISNFYTATVYEKGAEVVRMIHTLIGAQRFRRGMDLYFERFDGQAVTTDDFVQAMQDASGVDLSQFRRWYDQAGTPVLDASGVFDAQSQRYTLTVKQSCAPTPGQPEKLPLHIPFATALIGTDGREIDLVLEGDPAAQASKSLVLSVKAPEERFVFTGVRSEPVPSLLRDFSAPAILRFPYSDDQLTHLLAHDTDPFNRWEAGQRLAVNLLLRAIADHQAGRPVQFPSTFATAIGRVLDQADSDPSFTAEALGLPSEGYLAEQMAVVDPDAIYTVRRALRKHLAEALRERWLQTYERFATTGAYSPDAASAGRRALRNVALGFLMELDDERWRSLAMRQFDTADNMTDAMAALSTLANCECPERSRALDAFYARWKDEALVVDKWFSVQATSRLPDTLSAVKALMRHPAFELRNPNRVRALVSSFCHANQVRFHGADGGGYAFLADQVIALDPLNPQVAARLARAMDRWKKFDSGRQAHARQALQRIRDTAGLSRDTFEVVTRALA
jgi:aminopeptidase N